ncbi:MAG: helix-hairpin-helix domain-containing protein [Pseudomonadota bacterium]
MPTSILQVKGVGPATAEKLSAAGFASAEDLAAATIDQVSAVPGLGESRAKQIISDACQQLTAADLSVGGSKSADIAPAGTAAREKSKKDKPQKKKTDKNKTQNDKQKREKAKKDKNKKSDKKKKAKKRRK